MRLLIEIDERYKKLFYDLAKLTNSTIIEEEPELWMEFPEHVGLGIEKGLEQARTDQTKTYKEVKKILAER